MIYNSVQISALVREAERLVDEGGAVALIEQQLRDGATRSGRPRELSVRTLFVAQQALAFMGHFYLVDVAPFLNGLDGATRRRLKVRPKGVTFRQVQHLFHVIATTLYDREKPAQTRFNDFDLVTNCIATAGAHVEANNSTSIAVDGSDIESWGTDRGRFVYDDKGNYVGTVRRASDVDAHWRSKDNKENKKSFFGYDLTTAVVVREENGPVVPSAVKAMRFRPATYKTVAMALACVGDVAAKQGKLGDVLVDREYTMNNDGHDFLLPVRALGGEPIFALRENQLGGSGTVRGAMIIDGQPFSPSLPRALRMITPPRSVGAYQPNPQAVAEYEAAIKARSIYALVPHGTRRPNGAQVYMCPAAAGKLMCPLVASSLLLSLGTMPAANPPKRARPNTVCASKFKTFSAMDLPLSQRHLHGSTAWRISYARRGEVERSFGRAKDQSRENIRRGNIRVMGLAKIGLLISMALASTNRRMALSFAANKLKPPKKKRGRPFGQTVGTYKHVVLEAQNATEAPLRI